MKLSGELFGNKAEYLKNLFNSSGLGILEIRNGSFFHDENKFPFESKKGLVEYRVTLGKILDEDWLMEMYDIEEPTLKAFKNLYEGSDTDDFLNDKKRIGEIQRLDNELTFSVFLPKTTKVTYPSFIENVWECAVNYINLLSKTYGLFIGNNGDVSLMDSHALEPLSDQSKDFGNLLTEVDVKINNNNLNKAVDYSYRLYKDNKFFLYLGEFLDSKNLDYSDFIKQAVKICK